MINLMEQETEDLDYYIDLKTAIKKLTPEDAELVKKLISGYSLRQICTMSNSDIEEITNTVIRVFGKLNESVPEFLWLNFLHALHDSAVGIIETRSDECVASEQ